MTNKAFIDGFMYKCAMYGINPEDIYGKFTIDTDEHYPDIFNTSYPINHRFDKNLFKKPEFDLNNWLTTNKWGRATFNILRNKSLYGPKFFGLSYSRSF